MKHATAGNANPMSTNRMKLIYIAGETRSGSTLLSNILGEVDGFFNVGELVEIWDQGQDWPCSCGSVVQDCEVWSQVLDAAPFLHDRHVVDRAIRLRDRYARTKQVPRALWMPGKQRRMYRQLSPLLKDLEALYRTVQTVTGSRVIIDASKNTGYGYILGLIPTVDLYVVHLIRDSRATVHSWSRQKAGLWTQKAAPTALRWAFRNVVTEMYGSTLPHKYIRLNYETFIQRPVESVNNILSMIEMTNVKTPFQHENEVMLTSSHGICGNPDRFRRGPVSLRIDKRWEQMNRKDLWLVTLLTWPLLRRYHYPLMPTPNRLRSRTDEAIQSGIGQEPT